PHPRDHLRPRRHRPSPCAPRYGRPVGLAELDALDQAQLVRKGDATPAELVEAAIAHIEALDPKLNAVIQPRFDKARADAAAVDRAAPFAGVPIVVKDLYCHMAGDPFHKGMRFLKELDWP